jgi:hypothetical protein
MKQATYDKIWETLSEAFKVIQSTLRQTLPDVRMKAVRGRNDAFLFRGHAAYSLNERVIVISFDVQEKEGRLHVWGDISEETGYILKDVMDTTIEVSPEVDDDLIQLATQYASQCTAEVELIRTALA